jgi:hypothetical protein
MPKPITVAVDKVKACHQGPNSPFPWSDLTVYALPFLGNTAAAPLSANSSPRTTLPPSSA